MSHLQIAKGVQDDSGTGYEQGAITDGQFQQRSGTEIVGATLSQVPLDILDVYDAAGGQTFTGTAITVNLDTSRTNTDATKFSLASDEVTISATGTFLFSLTLGLDISSGTKSSVSQCYIEEDSGGGYAEVTGSRVHANHTKNTEGEGTPTRIFTLSVTSGDKFRVRAERLAGTSTHITVANLTNLVIIDMTEATISAASAVHEIVDLSDVAAKSGTGTTVLFQGSPTITTPTIADVRGDSASGGDLLLTSTTDATKGAVYVASGDNFCVGTSTPESGFPVTLEADTIIGTRDIPQPATTRTLLQINERDTEATNHVYGEWVSIDNNPASTPSGNLYGGIFTARGISAQTFPRVVGVQGQANINDSAAGSPVFTESRGVAGITAISDPGTITTAQAGYFQVLSNHASAVITNGYTVIAKNFSDTGTTTSKTGLCSEEMSGATNNTNCLIGTSTIPSGDYSIYNSSTRDNYMNGRIGVKKTPGGSYDLDMNADSAAKPGGGSWSDNSDQRLKKNIQPIANALEKILSLEGILYEWKEPSKHGNLEGLQYGMIAQTVEKVIPEWVREGLDGFKILTFRGFEALAVEAIRVLDNRIKAIGG